MPTANVNPANLAKPEGAEKPGTVWVEGRAWNGRFSESFAWKNELTPIIGGI